MVDLGVKFGEETRARHRRGAAGCLLHREATGATWLGIVLTHAHEDHLGAVAWLWPRFRCPVYCTPFAAALLERKLAEQGLDEEVPMHVMPLGGRFRSARSISNSSRSPIRSPSRLRPADPNRGTAPCSTPATGRSTARRPSRPRSTRQRLRQIGDEGVDALVCDSTNVLRDGHSPSEADRRDARPIVDQCRQGRVAITTFASHVGRIASAIRAARRRRAAKS